MSLFPDENFKVRREIIADKIAQIFPSISSTLLSNKDRFNEIFDGLTKDIPKYYSKKELEEATKIMSDVCDAIFREFISLIRIIVASRSYQTVNVFQVSAPEFEKKLGIKFSSDAAAFTQNLFIESKPYKKEFRQLLIVENPHEQVIKEIQHIKNEKSYLFILILNLNSAVADEIIENAESQKKTSEKTSNNYIWSDRLLIMNIPKDSTFADVIDAVLSWVYDVEDIEDKDVSDWIKEGKKAAEAHNYERALSSYESAIELNPDSVTAWYCKGLVNFNLEKYDEAIKYYDKALEIDPQNTEVLYNKGVALNSLGIYQTAIHCFEKALELSPRNGHALYGRAVSYARINNARNAIADLRKAIEVGKEK